jgi:ABC-2 type transport system permease protein
LPMILNGFKYTNDMLMFNSSGDQMRYSDMNGHGHTLPTFFLFKLYWIGFVLLLSTLAVTIYQRGKESAFKLRWKMGIKQLTGSYRLAFFLGLFLFAGCGSVIYYNTRILNPYVSTRDQEKRIAEFEQKYKQYEKIPQPRIVESNLLVDIFPDELGCKIQGFYYLKNKNSEPVTKLFLNVNEEIKGVYDIAGKLFLSDEKNGFYGYELNAPLLPGDSMKMQLKLEYFPKNFIMKNEQAAVVYNGSFFNSEFLPHIGYNPDNELSDNSTRKKYKLKPKPRMASITDTGSYKNTYISNDADWIRFECVVSTKEGQIAVAPGYLQKEWKEEMDGKRRHYFHYKMDSPILNFYAFLSAAYEVKKDVWVNPADKANVVNVEVYYHKGHEYNIERMIRGVKRSLDYYTKNFSPYQHKQVRILEFPRYASFAQSFPNTIPFSESIGFVAHVNENDPNEVDYPFYVTAHEVAHQWWAHQVIGANVQGSTIMSETMSQYSALMVMEKEFGQAAMSKFLKYEMNSYLTGRAAEGKKEVPLLYCENQQYIHYNKGSVVMYALKDYLGEDNLNAAIRKYIRKTAFQEAPFTTAVEFYSFLQEATPDSLQETLKDLFERIVIFENKVNSWTYTKTPEGKYKINAEIACIKTRSDSLGKANEVLPSDWIDIGVFVKNEKNQNVPGEKCFFQKIEITKNKQAIELIVDKEPYMFGIDPFYKLIDKNTGDNIKDKFGKNIGGGSGEASGLVVRAE